MTDIEQLCDNFKLELKEVKRSKSTGAAGSKKRVTKSTKLWTGVFSPVSGNGGFTCNTK